MLRTATMKRAVKHSGCQREHCDLFRPPIVSASAHVPLPLRSHTLERDILLTRNFVPSLLITITTHSIALVSSTQTLLSLISIAFAQCAHVGSPMTPHHEPAPLPSTDLMLSALSPTTSINLSPLVGTHCRLPPVAAPRPRPTLPRLRIVTCSAPSSPIAVSSAIDWPLSASVAELSSKKRQSPEPLEDLDERAPKSAKVVKRVRFIVPSNSKRDSRPCTPLAKANLIREACHSPSPCPSPSSLSDAASDDMRSPPSPLRSVDAPSSLLSSMQGVKLRSMSPDERAPGSPPSPTSTFNDSNSNPSSSAWQPEGLAAVAGRFVVPQ